jgi:hypothetical protein
MNSALPDTCDTERPSLLGWLIVVALAFLCFAQLVGCDAIADHSIDTVDARIWARASADCEGHAGVAHAWARVSWFDDKPNRSVSLSAKCGDELSVSRYYTEPK